MPPVRSTPRTRRNQRYANTQAKLTASLMLREAVIRLTHEGRTDKQIAGVLGISLTMVRYYRDQALGDAVTRLVDAGGDPRQVLPDPNSEDESINPTRALRAAPKGPGPGPHRPDSPKAPIEVIPGPEQEALRNAVLDGRKRAIPFAELAQELGVSESTVRKVAAEALRDLNASETSHAELERRLMVEQLDGMLRAIYPAASSLDDPDLDAADRVLKVMDRKSKLLGLDQVPAVDIMIKLQRLATENNYDIRELEDIARDVLSQHRFNLPPGSGPSS